MKIMFNNQNQQGNFHCVCFRAVIDIHFYRYIIHKKNTCRYWYKFCMSTHIKISLSNMQTTTWKTCFKLINVCNLHLLSSFHFISSSFWKFLSLLWHFVATVSLSMALNFKNSKLFHRLRVCTIICCHDFFFLFSFFFLRKPGSSALSNRVVYWI